MPKTTAGGGGTDAAARPPAPRNDRDLNDGTPAQPAIGEPASDDGAEEVQLEPVPSGTIPEVLEWVAADPGEDPSRVDRALAEEIRRPTPRSSLIATFDQMRADDGAPEDESVNG